MSLISRLSDAFVEVGTDMAEALDRGGPANLTELLAYTGTYPVGFVVRTRAEGYSYEVVTSNPDFTTAGGVQLRVLWRGDESDLLASGIDPTGTQDAAPLLNAYLAVRPGLVVTIPPGTYRLNSTVDIPSDTNLDLRNCTFNSGNTTTGQPLFRATGTQNAAVSMTTRPAKGHRTIYLDSTAGFARGDVVKIMSDAAFDPARTNSKIGELGRVSNVYADRIVLYSPLMDDYTVGLNGRVAKLNPVRRVNIIGPAKFEGGNTGNRKGIWIEKAVDCRIDGIDFHKFDDRALWMQDCDNVNGDNLTFQDFDSPGTGYGISVVDATQNCRFTGIHGRRVRHLFATNNTSAGNGIPRNVTLDGFTVDCSAFATGGSGGDAVDTHAASENINFWNGFIRNSTGHGIIMEGAGGTIRNVRILGADANGILVANWSGREGRIEISGVTIEDVAWSAIRVASMSGQSWVFVQVDATALRSGMNPFRFDGVDIKRRVDLHLRAYECAGNVMAYLNSARGGQMRVITQGATSLNDAMNLVRVRDSISVDVAVNGTMNNSNPASNGLLMEQVNTAMRNIMAKVNLRNEAGAGTGVRVNGGTNVVVDPVRVIDNFATAAL